MLDNYHKYTKEERGLVVAGVVFAVILLIILLIAKPALAVVFLIVGAVIYFAIINQMATTVSQKAVDLEHKLFCKRCADIISEHKNALINEKRRLSHQDAYGNAFVDKWYRDGVNYFINQVLRPRLTPELQAYLEKNNNYSEIAGVIDRVATLQT